MTDSRPRLALRLKVNLHGLVPDPHEFDPVLACYATFGSGRHPMKVSLTAAQQEGTEEIVFESQELPPLDQLRGDERFMFHVVPQTRLSGMPDLDATDREYVTRDKLGGFFDMPLARLLHREPVAKMPIEDPYLFESLLAESKPLEKASFGATKGTLLQLTATMTPPDAKSRYFSRLCALVDASERDPTQPLLLGTKRFERAHREGVAIIRRHYGAYFGGHGTARFPRAFDQICEVLHMPYFHSNQGDTLPFAFFAARDHPRLQPPKANYVGNMLYDVSPRTLDFYEQVARSCFASVGLSAEGARRALETQFRSVRTDALEAQTPRLIDATMRTLQVFGNNIKYRSDDRTPNRAYLVNEGRDGDAKTSYKGGALARTRYLLFNNDSASHGGGNEMSVEKANESMDDLSSCGILNANDCEDSTKPPLSVAADIEPLDPKLALDPKRLAKHPLLKSMALMLQRYDLFGDGVAAKSPYLDSSGGSAKPEMKVDYNGHIHGIGHSRVLAADLIKRGGTGDVWASAPAYFDRLDLEGKVTRNVAPFEALLPSVTIEGTSPGTTFIQPAEEIGEHWAACVESCRKVYKSVLRLGAPANAPNNYQSAMSQLFSPRQLPEGKEAMGGMMSSFYHAPIHAISERLAALDPRLAHFNYVDTRTGTRGVPVDQVMRVRPGDSSSTIALVTPYAEATDAEMATLYNVAAVIKNTQPAPAMTRFTSDADLDKAMLRVGHPLSDASFAALSQFKFPKRPPQSVWTTFTSALDNHSMGQRRKGTQFGAKSNAVGTSGVAGIEKLAPHLDREDRTVYSFFAPAWAAANADMARIDGELKELYEKGLILDHAIWRDRFLQHCDDQITLALVVPVNSSN
jgi:hypothetical protein